MTTETKRIKILEEALHRAIGLAQKHVCLHEDTHRGGASWEICNDCGMKWHDSDGGREGYVNKDAEELDSLMELL
jgi:hypothetical protein